MKVLISDKTARECREKLATYSGLEVVERPGLSGGALREAVSDCQGLIVRSATKVTAELLAAAAVLKVVGRAGAGVDNIDVKAASERGVLVMNTPGGNSAAVAELTVGLLFSLCRRIPRADSSMKQGQWIKKELEGTELGGKTLGLVGLGNVGRIVARLAAGIGMRVIASDPYLDGAAVRGLPVELEDLDAVLSRSDFISVHVPKSRETQGMLDAAAFGKMKRGVYFVNCSRGGIVVEADLLAALQSGQVAGAGVDVYDEEPPADLALVRHPSVVATPHIGASTAEAQVVVAVMIAEQVGSYLTTGEVRNAVNAPR